VSRPPFGLALLTEAIMQIELESESMLSLLVCYRDLSALVLAVDSEISRRSEPVEKMPMP